jgi:YgiT-type zinc finger domain-containing protein
MDFHTCPTCQIGQPRFGLATYLQVYGETVVSVPRVPAWTCDICGDRYFDPGVIRRLEFLLGQTGPPFDTADGDTVPGMYRPMPASDDASVGVSDPPESASRRQK